RVVYLKALHRAETGLANRLGALMSVPVQSTGMNGERISTEVLKKLAIQLSGEQLDVLEKIFSLRAVVITGGPGTGKTTLIRSITAVFEAIGKRVRLAAPTGRAARRLSEVTRRKASTIHRLLGYSYQEDRFDKNEYDPLDADVIIVDETSMVDTLLMFHLIRAVSMTAVLVLVGDVFQLPPVGPGNVLSDMIDSKQIPVFYLKEIFRQAKESPIVVNAHRVRHGKPPLPDESALDRIDRPEALSEFYFIEQHDPKHMVETIAQLCSRTIPEYFGFSSMDDIQVLTPMHRGLVGDINLNQVLQSVLNPDPIPVGTPGGTFKTNDKVMHLKNNYQKDVFNGDIGFILEIDRKNELITIDYYGRSVTYEFMDLDEISLAYAISVHKSQGSEYPAVILPLSTQHYPLLQRNLLYTALTRGQKLVVLTGSKRALAIALGNDKPGNRLSGLTARLRDCLPG
ncbi:ATP-dependent RecD-like DNA helicase, partial [Thermodesulfobacteriota bacterium]